MEVRPGVEGDAGADAGWVDDGMGGGGGGGGRLVGEVGGTQAVANRRVERTAINSRDDIIRSSFSCQSNQFLPIGKAVKSNFSRDDRFSRVQKVGDPSQLDLHVLGHIAIAAGQIRWIFSSALWLAPITRPRKGKNKVHSDGCGRRSGVGARGGGMRMAARPRAGRTVAEGRPESEWAGWGGGGRSRSSRNCYSMGDWEAADGGDGGAVGGVGAAAQRRRDGEGVGRAGLVANDLHDFTSRLEAVRSGCDEFESRGIQSARTF